MALRLTIIDGNGVVIADSQQSLLEMDNHATRPEFAAALSGNTTAEIRYSNTIGENVLYVAIPFHHQSQIIGVLRISNTLAQVEANFREIRSVLIAAFLITSLLAIAVSVRLAGKFTAPLEKITHAAQEIAQGNLEKRVHIHTGDEVEILAHALNNLASNLDDKVNEITTQKHKLELILEHMDNAVILLDRFGRVTTANKMALDLFDIAETMFGRHNLQVIGNSLLNRAVQETIASGQPRLIDLKTDNHGKKRVFQVFLAPVPGSGINGVLGVFHDITTLQELHERQVDFVANASHELATPLTAIKGFSETLLDGALDDPALRLKFVNIIHTEAERMHRLVKDLLQVAKLDSADYRQSIHLEPVALKALCETVVNELTTQWKKKNITVTIEHADRPVTLLTNPDWLKQVLINLMDNAITYTPAGGAIRLKYQPDAISNVAHVTVEDTGIGIPAKDLPLIFERFYRVDRARSRAVGGSGLGLAIVKFIVETLGGNIKVQSKLNVGTTFHFTLPLEEQHKS